MAYRLSEVMVGNGKDTFLCTKKAKVSSISVDNNWIWLVGRRVDVEVTKLIKETPICLLPNVFRDDHVKWKCDRTGKFTVSSAVKAPRQSFAKVDWWKIFWFKERVPRFAFILWLHFKRRLQTKDRLKAWVANVGTICGLC
ncbi:hypothetical protein ACH5RR_030281 [Cinchona calisaya]|uniref:Reverse transcriptase zinc-binding domain-containing protein n=1 Tax=Cinchona calisaya TaxID=153742 RepID=A0ABD2YXU6_9GENT